MTRDKAMEMLKKLLALADNAGSPGEAQAALSAAMKHATRHGLDLDEVRRSGDEDDEMHELVYKTKRPPIYIVTLVNELAKMCGCCMFTEPDGVYVWGRGRDRTVCKTLANATIDTMDQQHNRASRKSRRGVERVSFCQAFIEQLLERMAEAQNEVLDSCRTKALAIIAPRDRSLEAEKHATDALGLSKKSHRMPPKDHVSAALGADAAHRTKLPGEHQELGDGE